MKSLSGLFPKERSEDSRDIRVNCRGCGPQPDLGDLRCLRCLCEMIAERDVRTVTFVSANEVRLDGGPVKELSRLASLIGCNIPRTGKALRCRHCQLSGQTMADEIWKGLDRDNIEGYVSTIEKAESDCPKAESCRLSLREAAERIVEGLVPVSEGCNLCARRVMGV